MAQVLFNVFYYICFAYFIFIEISYMYFKIKKDVRFENVGLFKYMNSPIKILKGAK